MLQKPAKIGTPDRASAPHKNVRCVTGMTLRRPPNLRMSMTLPIACITDPEPRNSSALKKACVTRWNSAAVTASPGDTSPPVPRAMNMKPSWLTVE